LIIGVVVVSVHGGIASTIFSIHVQIADSVLLFTIIVKVYVPVWVDITELIPLY
jgi:hypothetical protein